MTPRLSPALLLVGLGLLVAAVFFILAALSAFGGTSIRGSFRCLFRGRHDPGRLPIGGFRCRDCGLAGATLNDFDHHDEQDGFLTKRGGYVTPPDHHQERARVRDTAPVLRPAGSDPGFYRRGRS